MKPYSASSWRAWLACALHGRRRDDDLMIVIAAFAACYMLFSR